MLGRLRAPTVAAVRVLCQWRDCAGGGPELFCRESCGLRGLPRAGFVRVSPRSRKNPRLPVTLGLVAAGPRAPGNYGPGVLWRETGTCGPCSVNSDRENAPGPEIATVNDWKVLLDRKIRTTPSGDIIFQKVFLKNIFLCRSLTSQCRNLA